MIFGMISKRKCIFYIFSRVIRGHYKLQNEGKAALIQELKNEICDHIVNLRLDSHQKNAELGTRADYAYAQFFYSKILNIYFNQSLLFFVGARKSLIYPLPKFARKVIEHRGINVNNFMCALLWSLSIIFFFLWSFIIILKYNCKFIAGSFAKKSREKQKLIMFNVSQACLADTDEPHKKNLTNWCFENLDLTPDCLVYHDAVFQKNVGRLINLRSRCALSFEFYPKDIVQLLLFNFRSISVFLASLISSFSISGLKISLLASQIDKLAFGASSITGDTVFCFNLANYVFRPLWVDVAEDRGCNVVFCMYSTNTELFLLEPGKELVIGWQLISWKKIYVWDQHQEKFLRRNSPFSDVSIHTVGPIPISDSGASTNIALKRMPTCAVFDVQPHRLSRIAATGYPNIYYGGKAASDFLFDIHDVTTEFKLNRVIKRKRNAGSMLQRRYASHIKSLLVNGWIEFPADANSIDLIYKSRFVICMPFTSVAIEAVINGIPAIYYDPGGLIYQPDRHAHSVPVLTSKHALRAWIKSLIE